MSTNFAKTLVWKQDYVSKPTFAYYVNIL